MAGGSISKGTAASCSVRHCGRLTCADTKLLCPTRKGWILTSTNPAWVSKVRNSAPLYTCPCADTRVMCKASKAGISGPGARIIQHIIVHEEPAS